MGSSNITSDEFDWLFEIILAILFMSFSVFCISRMIIQLDAQTNVTTRVDKVRLSNSDIQENSKLFEFTGYQAFMFSYMMDPYSPVDLYYMQTAGAKTQAIDGKILTRYPEAGKVLADITQRYIGLIHTDAAAGNIDAWQSLITGSTKEYSNVSVASIINKSAEEPKDKEKRIDVFRGTGNAPVWKLTFGGERVGENAITEELDGLIVIEQRRDFIWTLHPSGQ